MTDSTHTTKTANITLIYLPGLGDSYDGMRRFALKFWRRNGMKVVLVPMMWSDREESLDHKLERIGDEIRQAPGDVVLLGESAGGSMAIVAAATYADRVTQVITLCGKNVGADRVSPRLYKSHPAFRESTLRADAIVSSFDQPDTEIFDIFYSPYDPTVRPVDTLIPGARSHVLPGAGHLMVITLGLTVYKRRILAVTQSHVV